jgi:hypothetical protein
VLTPPDHDPYNPPALSEAVPKGFFLSANLLKKKNISLSSDGVLTGLTAGHISLRH